MYTYITCYRGKCNDSTKTQTQSHTQNFKTLEIGKLKITNHKLTKKNKDIELKEYKVILIR